AGLLAGDTQPRRQAACAHAIDDAEIDCLRELPLLRSNLLLPRAEHLRGHERVDVAILLERPAQVIVAAEMCEQAQLNLRVVSLEKLPTFAREERLSDPLPQLRSRGNVL